MHDPVRDINIQWIVWITLMRWLNEVHGRSAQVSGTSFTESLIGLTPNVPCVSPVQLTSLPYLPSLLSLQCWVFLKTPRQSRYCKRNWQKVPTLRQTLADFTPLSGMGLEFAPHAGFYGITTSVIMGFTLPVCGDAVSDIMTSKVLIPIFDPQSWRLHNLIYHGVNSRTQKTGAQKGRAEFSLLASGYSHILHLESSYAFFPVCCLP